MSRETNKKPDMYAKDKAVMPYGDSVAAPKIEVENLAIWKSEKVGKTNHYFKSRFDEIKSEYLKLIEEFKWNDLVYKAEIRFTPSKGEIYHLYQRENEELFLSLIEPEHWDQIYVGSFRLDSNDKWEKIES